jgi:hypothetical protein
MMGSLFQVQREDGSSGKLLHHRVIDLKDLVSLFVYLVPVIGSLLMPIVITLAKIVKVVVKRPFLA